MIRFFKVAVLASSFIFLSHNTYGNETYYIDNSPLLLYKTINWWYDCLPKESKKLCRKPIRCSNAGNAQIEYDAFNKKIVLKIKDGFATMLLAFKKCTQCYGPSYFRGTWLNKKYLSDATANDVLDSSPTMSTFTFNNIQKKQAEYIKNIQNDLQFTIGGVIGGLSNGQIALHESGDLLKKCEKTFQPHDDQYPITLKIKNKSTNEILVIYKMFWEQ